MLKNFIASNKGYAFLFSLFLLSLSFPIKTYAADLFDLFDDVLKVIDYLVLMVLALALVFFLWGMTQFIRNADSEEGRKNGKQVMLWGLIALFVMTSVWGIIHFLQSDIFGSSPETDAFDLITPP